VSSTRRPRGRVLPALLLLLAAGLLVPPAFFVPSPPEAAASNPRPAIRPSADTGAVTADLGSYRWPIPGQRKVTSTFAEFRRTHFHGGIDIGTGAKTGFRVQAMNRGSIVRARVEPTGYGKMLFVQHPDGHTTTYAHLAEFEGEVARLVREEQERRGTYRVDMTFPAGRLPVARGETIARSGATGTGSAHLHFELLDQDGNFINPLLSPSLRTPDRTPPDLRALAFIPVGEGSRVNGSTEPVVIRLRGASNRTLTLDEPVHITGSAGLAVDARDLSEGSPFRHAVYGYRLLLDGTPVFSIAMDRAPGSHDGEQVWLHYDPALYEDHDGRFQRLFNAGPPVLPFTKPWRDSAGVLSVRDRSAARRTFTLEAFDFERNTTAVSGVLFISPTTERPRVHASPDAFVVTVPAGPGPATLSVATRSYGNGGWSTLATIPLGPRPADTSLAIPVPAAVVDQVRARLAHPGGLDGPPGYWSRDREFGEPGDVRMTLTHRGDRVSVAVRADGEFTVEPRLSVKEGAVVREIPLEPTGENRYTATVRPSEEHDGERLFTVRARVNGRVVERTEPITLHPLVPGRTGSIRLADGFCLEYDSLSVFSTLLLEIAREEQGGVPVWSLRPGKTVFRGGVRITLPVPPGMRRPGFYYASRGELGLVGRPGGSNPATLQADLRRWTGSVAVLDDTDPPEVWKLSIGSSKDRRPPISFRYRDLFAGVEYDSFKVYIDATPVIPEIDGEHRRASFRPGQPLARGQHRLRIRLVDRVGNAREVERAFTVR
jgi:hypothetical protein